MHSNTNNHKDIWSKMQDMEVVTNMKEYIIRDKEAQRDLRDGLRFLMGRRQERRRWCKPILVIKVMVVVVLIIQM